MSTAKKERVWSKEELEKESLKIHVGQVYRLDSDYSFDPDVPNNREREFIVDSIEPDKAYPKKCDTWINYRILDTGKVGSTRAWFVVEHCKLSCFTYS